MKKIKYISILLLTLLVTIGFRMDVRGDGPDYTIDEKSTPSFEDLSTEIKDKLAIYFHSRINDGKEKPNSCSSLFNENIIFASGTNLLHAQISDCSAISVNGLFDVDYDIENSNIVPYGLGISLTSEGKISLTLHSRCDGWFNFKCREMTSYTLDSNVEGEPAAIVFEFSESSDYCYRVVDDVNRGDFFKCDRVFYVLNVAKIYYLKDYDEEAAELENDVKKYIAQEPGLRFVAYDHDFNRNSKNKYDQCVEDYGYELDSILDISKKIKNFDLLDDLLTKNHNGGYGISSSDVKRNLENFLKQSDYYTKNKDANAISEAIKTDCEKVDKFVQENRLFNCLNDNYQSTDGVYRYKNKNPDFKGTYVYSLQDFCKYSDEENVSDLLNGMEIDNQQSELIKNYSDKCSGYAGPDSAVEAQKNVCLNKEITEDIAKINCDKLGSGEFDSEEESINELMKYMYWYSSEYKCKGSNKLDLCIKSYCTEIQSDPKSITQEIINGATPEQEKADNIYNSLYNNLYESKTIELKFGSNELCSRIKMLEDYLKGGLNLIRIAGPIITIILTIMDGMKTFASFKDDESKKFFNRLYKRLICIAILFLVPTIIYFLLGFIMPINEVCKI